MQASTLRPASPTESKSPQCVLLSRARVKEIVWSGSESQAALSHMPLSMARPAMGGRDDGLAACMHTLTAPADCPNTIILLLLPPKAAAFVCDHHKAKRWSIRP